MVAARSFSRVARSRQVEYGDEPGSHGYKPLQADRERSVDYLHSSFADQKPGQAQAQAQTETERG